MFTCSRSTRGRNRSLNRSEKQHRACLDTNGEGKPNASCSYKYDGRNVADHDAFNELVQNKKKNKNYKKTFMYIFDNGFFFGSRNVNNSFTLVPSPRQHGFCIVYYFVVFYISIRTNIQVPRKSKCAGTIILNPQSERTF